MLLKFDFGTIISFISLAYRFWKDGVFSKERKVFKRNNKHNHFRRKTRGTVDFDPLSIQQKQLYILAAKLQFFFSIKRGKSFLHWRQWFEFMNGLEAFAKSSDWLDSGKISYMRGNMCAGATGARNDQFALIDAIQIVRTDFDFDGEEVPHSYLELLLRNYMSALQHMQLSSYGIEITKKRLRPLQMIMLTGDGSN